MRGISKPQQINIEIILTLILVLLQLLFHIFTVILSTNLSVSIKNEAMYFGRHAAESPHCYNVVFKGRNIKSNEFTEELLVYLSFGQIHMKNNSYYGTPNCKHNDSNCRLTIQQDYYFNCARNEISY